MATKKLNMKGISSHVISGITSAGGGVAGSLVDRFIPGSINPKLVQGGKIIVGALLPEFLKGSTMEKISAGFCGQAGGKLFESFVPPKVSGTGDETIGADTSYSIEEDTSEVSGDNDEMAGILSGIDEEVAFE
jgi:hypothetical protein